MNSPLILIEPSLFLNLVQVPRKEASLEASVPVVAFSDHHISCQHILHVLDQAGTYWCFSTGQHPPHPANPRVKGLRSSVLDQLSAPRPPLPLFRLRWGAGEEVVHWLPPSTAHTDVDTQMPRVGMPDMALLEPLLLRDSKTS